MASYLAVVTGQIEAGVWARNGGTAGVSAVGEFRHLCASLAGRFGCLHQEPAASRHVALFESPDAAARFALALQSAWRRERLESTSSESLELRIGVHFGDCVAVPGGGWAGRAPDVCADLAAQAEVDTVVVSAGLLELLELPLYRFEPAGEVQLDGDVLGSRHVYRLLGFEGSRLTMAGRDLRAEDWFLQGAGMLGSDRENSEQEADCYRQALRLRPDYPEAHNNLAAVQRALGDTAAAAGHYREALRLRPDYPEAHYNYSLLLLSRGALAEAVEHLGDALRLRPDYVAARHCLAGLLLRRGEAEEAETQFREALRLRPEYAEAHSDLAVLLDGRGRAVEAAEHYREALRLRPDFAQAHYNFALLLESQDDGAGAGEHYRAALEAWPDYPEAHNNLGALLHSAGDLETAETHYRRALELRPGDPEIRHNLGLLLKRSGRPEEAAEFLRSAREAAPEEASFQSQIVAPGPARRPSRAGGTGSPESRGQPGDAKKDLGNSVNR